jgi:choline kinase
MVAVILAAGQGTRLLPLTAHVPKCLIQVGGRPLLARMLDAVAAAGIDRAIVVTGYLSDRVDAYLEGHELPIPVTTVRNPDYATTNNAVSLAMARPALRGEAFLLSDGDIIFSESPLPALLAADEPCTLAVDRGAPLADEEMKVQVDDAGLVTQLSKGLDPRACTGESIGVQKLGGPALPLMWDELAAVVRNDAETAYYEDVFQRLIDRGIPFGVSDVTPGSWLEIDDSADLAVARQRFGV